MKIEELNKLKIGDIIYSFVDKNFYIYKVTNINLFTHEITVCIESVNNIKNSKDYSIIDIPIENRYNDIKYGYEFTTMDLDLNTAYQNYSEYINTKINKLNGMRANMKGLKRKYMLNENMIPKHEKTWKELEYKSKEDYREHMNDLYDDIRHGYIG
jgi:hypothetical protein